MTDTERTQLTEKAQELVTLYRSLDAADKVILLTFLEADGTSKNTVNSILTDLKARLEKLERWDHVDLNFGSVSSGEILRCVDGEFIKAEEVLALIDSMLSE